MSVREKLTAALHQRGITDFGAAWVQNRRGAPRNFVVKTGAKTYTGSTLRALLRTMGRKGSA